MRRLIENLADEGLVHRNRPTPVRGSHLADSDRQCVFCPTRTRFLVAASGSDKVVNADRRRPIRRKPRRANRLRTPRRRPEHGNLQSLGERRLVNHADRHRLTVKDAIAAAQLDGVANCVTEVERL